MAHHPLHPEPVRQNRSLVEILGPAAELQRRPEVAWSPRSAAVDGGVDHADSTGHEQDENRAAAAVRRKSRTMASGSRCALERNGELGQPVGVEAERVQRRPEPVRRRPERGIILPRNSGTFAGFPARSPTR
jgi:hypothetical protein